MGWWQEWGKTGITEGCTEEGLSIGKSGYFVVMGPEFDIQHFQVQLWGQGCS